MHKPESLNPTPISLAIRAYPEPRTERKAKPMEKFPQPETMLVFDTETRTDATQALMFGCYRFIDRGRCGEEGLFYADDLSISELEILKDYVKARRADRHALRLLSLAEFLKRFCAAAYKARSMVVGFNLPFDLSRLGFEASDARREFGGGFSLGLWTFTGKDGMVRLDPNRPRVTIKHMDSKRALMSFTGRRSPDTVDLIPEHFSDGRPQKGYKFRGHFLDLRTLSFALTDRGHSLKSACEAFGVSRGKIVAEEHGKITPAYIDYCRRDVEATAELAERLLAEYALHPISLPPTKAFSPASIGKAYLREMGIDPILQRQPELVEYAGYAQSAFFGGRTSAHIRQVPVPVVYTDFLSMYPTVNSLMDLWSLVVAKKITIIDHCKDEIQAFLESVTVDDLFRPETWKNLRTFVRVLPDGDILPTRGRYNAVGDDWQVAINYLYVRSPDDSLWFTLPDVIVSVLLTGKIPTILDAFKVEASKETLPTLRSIKLRGAIEIDPRSQDFFRVVIEERKKVGRNSKLSAEERNRLDKTLKVLANSTSYGIYGQMDRREANEPVTIQCRGRHAEPYKCRVEHPEEPGEFCFPVLASLITGAARLMLGLLEKCVTDLGGMYAMEDTDSMAIVATEKGGVIACPGGTLILPDGQRAINALSWAEVRKITERFESLNPYDRAAIPGSVLKIEDCNFDPLTKTQRETWCLAISAKRYALFIKEGPKSFALLRKGDNSDDNQWSEHGLGHLLNPIDLESDDREWTAQVWESIISECLGISSKPISFAKMPAIGRITVTSPPLLKPLDALNDNKSYAQQIKPFNFLLTSHVNSFGHPMGADPGRFHLIAPYSNNPKEWLRIRWTEQYSDKTYKVTTEPNGNDRQTAWIKTFGDVIAEYANHPESKCANEIGEPADQRTVGLLYRRHVLIAEIIPIGKESNNLDEVDVGLAHSADGVYTVYLDPSQDAWEQTIRPTLHKISLSVLKRETGLPRNTIINARRGRTKTQARTKGLLTEFARKYLNE